ncbi:hypothetical protein N7534_003651 [Penicillium rubens]|nr:hypothetical protein N7534_003651 [Penicillium rubens]KAJ6136803.1 hypothetical protein N7497_012356 [Penicillium chrysogenum]
MSLSSSSTISIINVSQGLSGLRADVSRVFVICYREYDATGTPLGEETITGVRLEEGSLTPVNDSHSIAAIFQNSEVIQDISDDPQIGGLKLVVYEWVIYSSFMA